MSSISISTIVFASVFGGALIGMFIRAVLPQQHLSSDSKDVVKLGMALVSTMAAIALGLLISSAKSSYDAQSNELTEMSAKLVLLDRVLAHYGEETGEIRGLLHSSVVSALDRLWPQSHAGPTRVEAPSRAAEILVDKMQELSPKDDRQRMLQAQALTLMFDLGRMRWLQFAQGTTSVTIPLLVVLVFWLTTLFIGFGIFAPANATVVASLFVSSLSVSAAILLILELYSPFSGLIRVSSAPMRAALSQLGR
jgi:hypothetical protein